MGLGRIDLSDLCQAFIVDILPAGSTIVELGSGYGTKRLTKHYTVYSVEQNKSWVGFCDKSNYIHAPIIDGWYDPGILKEQLPGEYDMLIIDGPGGVGRSYFMRHIELFPNLNNIPIIVDDANRNEERILLNELSNYLGKEYSLIENDPGTAYFMP